METTLENAKLAIFEPQELNFFSPPPNHGGERLGSFPSEDFLVFYINHSVTYTHVPTCS